MTYPFGALFAKLNSVRCHSRPERLLGAMASTLPLRGSWLCTLAWAMEGPNEVGFHVLSHSGAPLMGADMHRKRRAFKGPPFVQLFNYVVDSQAYRGLTTVARSALVEFVRLYNGRNNGFLAMPTRTLAERLSVSKTTASRAILELEQTGFIETVKVGSFRRRDRMASEYRLTFHRCDASGAPPSRAFHNARPKGNGFKSGNSGPVGETVAA